MKIFTVKTPFAGNANKKKHSLENPPRAGGASKVSSIHLHLTLEYMRWRFVDPPIRSYQSYGVDVKGITAGYVVARTVED